MNLADINFQYHGIDCDYDYQYDCHNSGCNDEGICRCGSIHNECISKIDIPAIVERIYIDYVGDNDLVTQRDNKLKSILFGTGRELDIYTIDRIVRKYKLYDDYSWDIDICGGYYGQELDGINIVKNIANKIQDELNIAFSIDELNGRIEYLLGLEYGSLLPELENCNYEIVELDKSDVVFGSTNHYDKVKQKDLTHYDEKSYDGIRGVVLEKDGKLRVIDGYHRIHTAKGPMVKVFKAKKLS
jgi:hypothetical protein